MDAGCPFFWLMTVGMRDTMNGQLAYLTLCGENNAPDGAEAEYLQRPPTSERRLYR